MDQNIADYQVALAEILPEDRVLEVGGGHGVLTQRLEKTGAKITCIEKDRELAEELRLLFSNIEIIEGDALHMEWPEFDVFVSNVPYAISSELTMKLIDHSFRKAVLMYQEEFAHRIVEGPGSKTYSRIGVKVQYAHACKLQKKVPPGAFSPPPKVNSAIITIEPSDPTMNTEDLNTLHNVVDVLFSHRRKKARNNLWSARKRLVAEENYPALDNLLKQWQMSENRVEHIHLSDMVRLANAIHILNEAKSKKRQMD